MSSLSLFSGVVALIAELIRHQRRGRQLEQIKKRVRPRMYHGKAEVVARVCLHDIES